MSRQYYPFRPWIATVKMYPALLAFKKWKLSYHCFYESPDRKNLSILSQVYHVGIIVYGLTLGLQVSSYGQMRSNCQHSKYMSDLQCQYFPLQWPLPLNSHLQTVKIFWVLFLFLQAGKGRNLFQHTSLTQILRMCWFEIWAKIVV